MHHTPIRLLAEEDRPREKLKKFGKSSCTDKELLAILIGSGTKHKSALDIAGDLLNACQNNLRELGKVSASEMSRLEGLGPTRSLVLIAALELGRRRAESKSMTREVIRSSELAYKQFQFSLSDLNHEEFWALYLSSGSKLIDKKRISSGGWSGTVADVRVILKHGIDLKATAMIVAHNHPSGNLKPSEPDIRLTKKLKEASEIMDIRLLDHLIIGDQGYFSFADEGLIF